MNQDMMDGVWLGKARQGKQLLSIYDCTLDLLALSCLLAAWEFCERREEQRTTHYGFLTLLVHKFSGRSETCTFKSRSGLYSSCIAIRYSVLGEEDVAYHLSIIYHPIFRFHSITQMIYPRIAFEQQVNFETLELMQTSEPQPAWTFSLRPWSLDGAIWILQRSTESLV